jgi:hypothetical protein
MGLNFLLSFLRNGVLGKNLCTGWTWGWTGGWTAPPRKETISTLL